MKKFSVFVVVVLFALGLAVSEAYVNQTAVINTTASQAGLVVNILNNLGPTVAHVVFGSSVSFQITYSADDQSTLTTLVGKQPTTAVVKSNAVNLTLVGGGNINASVLGAWCPDARPWNVDSPKIVCEPWRFTPSPSYSPATGAAVGAVLIVTVPPQTRFCVNGWCASPLNLALPDETKMDNFQDLGNGAIYDNIVGVMWQKIIDSPTFPYKTDFKTIVPVDDYCRALTIGGYTDWRIPTRMEAMRTVDYRIGAPALNSTFFPDINGSVSNNGFWTQSRDPASDYEGCWYVLYGGDGSVAYSVDVNPQQAKVRCVRTVINKFNDPNRFGKLTVHRAVDYYTGLQWNINYSKQGWDRDHHANSTAQCANLRDDGFSDWRLPTILEMNSFQQEGGYRPPWNSTVFPVTTKYDWWAASNIDAKYGGNFWWVWNGVSYPFSSGEAYSRCVRGPSFVNDSSTSSSGNSGNSGNSGSSSASTISSLGFIAVLVFTLFLFF